MKKLFLLSATLIFAIASIAQSYEGSIDFDKKKQEAFVIDFNYTEEAVEKAIVTRMENAGHKTDEGKGFFSKNKGFKTYKSITIKEIANEPYDYIFKTDKKAGSKSSGVLYMIILRNGTNVRSELSTDAVAGAKSFMNAMEKNVVAADLELQVVAQEVILAKSEKKFKKLEDEKSSMEKKIEKLKEEIKTNIKDQEVARVEIENNKKIVDGLKLKRK